MMPSRRSSMPQCAANVISNMKKDIKNYKDLLAAFRYNLRDIDKGDDLLRVLRLLSRYYELMQEVQRLPWLLRLKFFACAFLIFNYLRLHKQLGREDHFFGKNVRKNVFKLFSTLMNNDEHRGDKEQG